jgi:hypothetical protein
MKILLSVTTDKFNSTEQKPNFINDRCFGEDFVTWLVDKFRVTGFVLEEPFQEDWGWATLARSNGETFAISIGIMDESIGEQSAEWLITVEKMRKFLFFGSKNSPHLTKLADAIESILRDDPCFTNLDRRSEP